MNLFAYGTLMDPEIMTQVAGIRCRFNRAVLSDYVRKAVRGEVYPAIVPHPGRSVDGVVYFDLTAAAFERLDAFEGPLYVRTGVSVALESGGQAGAETYVIAPERIHRLSDRDWSFEHFLNSGKAAFQRGYEGFGKLEE